VAGINKVKINTYVNQYLNLRYIYSTAYNEVKFSNSVLNNLINWLSTIIKLNLDHKLRRYIQYNKMCTT